MGGCVRITGGGENLENQFAKNYTSFSSRFRFNGKEWDEETGNFYYGARYYDPKISVWLSVDPLAHEYPSLNSFTFVANNPINLFDPNGMWIAKVDDNGSAFYVAEEGDDFMSFMDQYDISEEDALKVFEKNNLSVGLDDGRKTVTEGSSVRGAGFLKYNLSKTDPGFFKFDYWSKETQQKAIDHMDFAISYAKANGLNEIDTKKVYNYDPFDVAGLTGGARIDFYGSLNGIPVMMSLNFGSNVSPMGVYPSGTNQRFGAFFGGRNHDYYNYYEYRASDGDLPIMRVNTPSKYSSKLSKYLYR